jgi:hypothetical protein
MSGISKKLMGTTAAAGGEALAIEDVFSTYLYTADTLSPTITNGIDLLNEGGLVWTKARNFAFPNILVDTETGISNYLESNATFAAQTGTNTINTLYEDGYKINAGNSIGGGEAGYTHVSWTFRKAPRFFDCVEYTGTGPGSAANEQQVSHNLGIKPGAVIVKRTDSTGDWWFFTDVIDGSHDFGYLNQTAAFSATSNNVPTDTVFNVGGILNSSGATYVAYLFAHDPLGPSGDGSDGLIACGSYTGDGTTDGSKLVNTGWEPQWLLIKNTTRSENWLIIDSMRGASYDNTTTLFANLSQGDATSGREIWTMDPQGFRLSKDNSDSNQSGDNYIYIAIRRGPMRAPESGTEVFKPFVTTSITSTGSTVATTSYDIGFPSDMAIQRRRESDPWYIGSRLTGTGYMQTNATNAELSAAGVVWDTNVGTWNFTSSTYGLYTFRRAPGFFDVVAYTGTTSAPRVLSHNLSATPELLIFKSRSSTTDNNWNVQCVFGPSNRVYRLNNGGFSTGTLASSLTDTSITLNDNTTNNAVGYICYLFATLPGVSKVGSYTGNGSSQTIDCGFTSGARFILIKRTDAAADWYVWDTARGIVTGNDPFLELNTTDAEVTSDDSIDPDSSGFIVNQTATTNVNVSSAIYIFYAIA